MSKKKEAGKAKAEILIVEDSPTQATRLKHILNKAEYKVSVATNGLEALIHLKDHKPTLVISDILMPEMDGYELCKKIKSIRDFRDIPVMLLTALSDPEDVVKGLECGADNFVTKPYSEKSILSQIQYIISNKELRVKRIPRKEKVEILVVEDSPTQAQQLKNLLEQHEHRVTVAGNGSEALALLEKHKPTLIISDIVMPEMDGCELCTKIKTDERLKDIPVVLLTALSDPEDVVKGLECGADHFITKPYIEDSLTSQVNYIIMGKEARVEHVAELGIEIFFSGKKHMITSNRMQIIDLLLSTHETAIQKKKEVELLNIELTEAHNKLKTLNEELEDKVKQRTEKIEHLKAMLQSIRNINQLIVQEKDRDRLIQGACDIFVKNRDFKGALTVLINENGKFQSVAAAGYGNKFRPMKKQLKRGEFPECVRKVINQQGICIIDDSASACGDCPLSDIFKNVGVVSSRLEYEGKIYGVLVVTSSLKLIYGEEEQSLLMEAVADISFALHSIELEEKHRQVENERDNLLYDLTESVKELNFLYGVSKLVTEEEKSLEDIFHETVKLIPPSWQYPDITCARIVLKDSMFKTENFRETNWKQSVDIKVSGKKVGIIEVFFLEEMNELDEGPFLKEERELINDLGGKLGIITGRKQAEKELRESEERYRVLFEGSTEGILITDIETKKFVFANPAFCKMLTYSEEEIKEMSAADIHPKEALEHVISEFEAQTRGEKTLAPDIPCLRKDGKIIYTDISTIVVTIGGRECNVGFFTDITEHKRLEEQFRQAQKMEGIGRLAGGVAHDFNNLLTVITGHVELALTTLDTRDPLSVDLQEIQKAGDKAAELTRQLLAFSRKQTMQLKILSLNTTITNLDKMLRRIIGEDIDLVTISGKDLWNVEADPGQIDQVIINFAINARDAMPEGGKLTIETLNVELDEEYANTHPDVTPGPHVMLAISDTGCGMTDEVKAQVFDPFFTTKGEGKGTGLGLSTVYGIVKQSGGNIWIYSELDKGTTFKIYLPMVVEEVDKLTHDVEIVELPRGTETILVVEDEKGVRKLACQILKQQGYKIIEAANGGEALMICKELEKPVDLVVTDVIMPNIGGAGLVKNLHEIWPDIKVLYMSGYTANAIEHSRVLDPDKPYLQKPFRPIDLAWKVRRVLDE